MSIDAMKTALEAMEELHRTGDTQVFDLCYAPKVIPALRLAIEQAEKQEPVAWLHVQGNYEEPSLRKLADDEVERGWEQYPLYTAPPQRQPLEDLNPGDDYA